MATLTRSLRSGDWRTPTHVPPDPTLGPIPGQRKRLDRFAENHKPTITAVVMTGSGITIRERLMHVRARGVS